MAFVPNSMLVTVLTQALVTRDGLCGSLMHHQQHYSTCKLAGNIAETIGKITCQLQGLCARAGPRTCNRVLDIAFFCFNIADTLLFEGHIERLEDHLDTTHRGMQLK